jgi:hypothetical protein
MGRAKHELNENGGGGEISEGLSDHLTAVSNNEIKTGVPAGAPPDEKLELRFTL